MQTVPLKKLLKAVLAAEKKNCMGTACVLQSAGRKVKHRMRAPGFDKWDCNGGCGTKLLSCSAAVTMWLIFARHYANSSWPHAANGRIGCHMDAWLKGGAEGLAMKSNCLKPTKTNVCMYRKFEPGSLVFKMEFYRTVTLGWFDKWVS